MCLSFRLITSQSAVYDTYGTQGLPDIRMPYLMLYLCVPNIIVDRPNHCYRISSRVFPLRTSYPFFITVYVKWRICN